MQRLKDPIKFFKHKQNQGPFIPSKLSIKRSHSCLPCLMFFVTPCRFVQGCWKSLKENVIEYQISINLGYRNNQNLIRYTYRCQICSGKIRRTEHWLGNVLKLLHFINAYGYDQNMIVNFGVSKIMFLKIIKQNNKLFQNYEL